MSSLDLRQELRGSGPLDNKLRQISGIEAARIVARVRAPLAAAAS